MSFFSKQIDKRIAAYQRELIETHYREVENMFDEEMITKYRYIILLLGTAVSFVFGFVVAFALAKLCGVMAVKAVLNIAFTAGGITGMLGFVCICLAELRRI